MVWYIPVCIIWSPWCWEMTQAVVQVWCWWWFPRPVRLPGDVSAVCGLHLRGGFCSSSADPFRCVLSFCRLRLPGVSGLCPLGQCCPMCSIWWTLGHAYFRFCHQLPRCNSNCAWFFQIFRYLSNLLIWIEVNLYPNFQFNIHFCVVLPVNFNHLILS